MNDAVEKVRQALKDLGSKREVVETQDLITTLEDASQAVGVIPGEILKSLIFLVDGSPWLVLMSGANKVHSGNVKRLAGGKRATMARRRIGFLKPMATVSVACRQWAMIRNCQLWLMKTFFSMKQSGLQQVQITPCFLWPLKNCWFL